MTVRIGTPLTFDDVVAVARHDEPVEVTAEALAAVDRAARHIDDLADDVVPHYGISTGFGALASKRVPREQRVALQHSLIRSHAASTGAEVEREVIRAMMLLRLKTMASGHTGVRREVVLGYAAMLNAGITPIVGEYGSLGCSGDLAPLAHAALALTGEGVVRDRAGQRMDAAAALAAAGLEPLTLREKEGLALINGTDGMLGQLILALADLHVLVTTADLTAAMTVQALCGIDAVFSPDLQQLRPHAGQAASAANILALLAGSPLIQAGKDEAHKRVQDAYSLRCAPQVHGAVRDTMTHAEHVAGVELVSAVDNPAVTDDLRVESNGNFHGAPVAYVLDFLAIAVADLASMSERRTDRMLDPARSRGLNAFLADDPGVDSGYMIAQYTQAGIVSELKRLAVPASVDSIPTSAMQEDHVSMGWSAARKLRRSVDGLGKVLGIEALTAARAIDLRGLGASAPVNEVVALMRGTLPAPGPDRFLAPDIAEVDRLVATGALVEAARGRVELG
ncbi:histidine ammonia-lyase [Cutibacterium avidum]|uniref:histidine ammonia-lyase n=1 Tax=Cutibacterium avidum TaxID=33010 RepID=UPI00192B8488|nr:histidine ammonia-lyase [Cutibacterium avidum]QQY15612.1 histidine ammonia-lyase [Cutibacterium avidum]